ncbi:sigma-70 family RNA polymerase sigma factor [Rhodoferax sp. GW822-FHT02A01]|uniref:sigma-70 family RNA polymerase sigma factor n=1 Tax=Rhodoferax sp. GW822-FHT02A01 TaxID=3141537 RepID=UPI00315DCE97
MKLARNFEATILPLLDSGFNLARWLLRNDANAEDAVQEAVLRAMKYFDKLKGDDARAWFLGIVRNVCFTHLNERKDWREVSGQDESALEELQYTAGLTQDEPSVALHQSYQRQHINAALSALVPALREVLVLRELEGLEYEQIARIASIPVGTVMSRLSRARARMRELLTLSGARE